jgi:hypothetical protein
MKNFYTLLLFLFSAVSILAQAPEKMSYQAVLRDASNVLLTNQSVGMQISILQGTITGTAVYTETQTTTTNLNGLVSLEIGSGTSSDNFSTIDWSAGPYFIKTATDPAGGTSYSITGTSQIMSMPYALYAKNSGVSQANATNISKNTADIATSVKAITANTDKVVITAQQSDAITANIVKVGYTDAQVSANTDVAANTAKVGVTSYSVGDFAHGGIVFWIDETGQHGLVCAKVDTIIAAQVSIGDDGAIYAARICNELQVTEGGKTYGDWFLPSKDALNIMYQNRATINSTAKANNGSAFLGNDYRSSKGSGTGGLQQLVSYGSQDIYMRGRKKVSLRAIRAF